MADLTAQKQACIDLSNAAIEFFDLLDEHGEEAAWVPGGVEVITRLADAYEATTGPTRALAARRMVALAMHSDDPGKLLTTFGMLGGMADDG